ncbi:MAG TPA: hypothetical protein ENK28_07895 [Aliiroseovarius sp.]|nr:hypothetical protein [Aliiroseovarius sp.]
MVNASKILTVSYGTFSCTLEGFDDPFSTMRSIAEYFRDLAADDRYFGAEPPTPDAEMLHRIAEREIQHRVEARVEDNNVVLRQADTVAPTGAATMVAGEALLETAADDSAEDLTPDAVARQAPQEDAAPQDADEMADDHGAEAAAPDFEDDVPADLTDSSIAAKLRRIRAVVDNRAADATREDRENGLGDDFFNDAGDEYEPLIDAEADIAADDPFEAEEFVEEDNQEQPLSDDAASEILSGISAALHEDTVEEQSDDIDQSEIDTSDNLAADDGIEDGAEDDEDIDLEDENVFAEDEAPEPKPVAIARVVKVRRKQPAPVEEVEDMGEGNSMLSPEDEAALMAELAEVARDAELETAQEGQADQDQNEASQTRTAFDDGDFEGADALDRIMAETNSKLESDEVSQKRTSIAHLRAAVQAKRVLGDDDDTADQAEDYRQDLAQVVHPRRPAIKGGKSSRRLAPLVLVSEQRVDEPAAPEAEADTTPVRPRRVRKVSPEDIKPVEQAAKANADTEEAFNAFAVQVGAKAPIEILEAAAAWRIFVREQETFSRPQVMRLLLKSDPTGQLTREEGLRAFGKLIRDGVIEKIQRGRYTISEHSQYRPGKNRASA